MNKKFALLIIMLLLIAHSLGYAKTSFDMGSELLEKERQKRQEQRLKKPLLGVKVAQEDFERTEELEQTKFYITDIIVSGNTVFSNRAIRQVTDPYLLREISLNDVSELVYKLTNQYIEKGYGTTRVLVPNQNIKKSQKLILNVMEGFVEEIIYVTDRGDGSEVDISQATRDNMSFWEKLRIWMAFPLKKGDILNTRKLDQGMDNYNRLVSNNVQLFLVPGDVPGGTKIVLKGKREDVFRGNVVYDNSGSVSTGQDKVRLQLEQDNLLGINDTITAYHISTKNTNAVAFNYSVPFKNWLFIYDWTYSEYLSLIDGSAEMFGKIRNYSMTAYRTLFRDEKKKIGAKFSFNRKKSVRFYNDIQLNPQPLTIVRAGLDYEYRGQKDAWYIEGNYSQGIGYKAIIDEPNLSGEEPHAQFEKWDAGITYYRFLSERLNYKGILRGQYALDPLYSSEQVFLGGVDSVRGFIDSPSAGDTGFYVQNEIATQIGQTNLKPYLFWDAGMTYDKANDKKEYLSGSGVGIRCATKRISFDLSYGFPIYQTEGVKKNSEGEFYAGVTVKLF